MKISQLAFNLHAASPSSNMAVYSHAAWLTNKLVDRGHQVTLFASGDSDTKAELISTAPTALSKMNLSENAIKHHYHLLVSKCYNQASKFDIIHSHYMILSSFYSGLVSTPTVNTLHSPISEEIKPFLRQFSKNRYISFSLAQRKTMPELNWIGNIYHGVDIKIFSFNPKPKNYFLYLGRITKEKGVHLAIKAAKAAGVNLIIAGRSYPKEGYWHQEIEKYIDGEKIKYIGEANFKQKIELYQNAKALLFPTQYWETFGLVMIEAMACGTPVIGWDKGSVPEIVNNGKTGFVIKSVAEMIKAIKVIDVISREETRKRAEAYFSIEKMVSGYEKIYKRIIEEDKFKKQNGKKHN
ncbi:glycosyltransferase family 4 protein [Patescibacteria group bacterium]|nr:glycosyltransferase family 4 protein [Patescibacteria group bacterium]